MRVSEQGPVQSNLRRPERRTSKRELGSSTCVTRPMRCRTRSASCAEQSLSIVVDRVPLNQIVVVHTTFEQAIDRPVTNRIASTAHPPNSEPHPAMSQVSNTSRAGEAASPVHAEEARRSQPSAQTRSPLSTAYACVSILDLAATTAAADNDDGYSAAGVAGLEDDFL